MSNIVIITSGQPSLNPRLVKEADALASAGQHVIVLYQYWNNWGTEVDSNLLKNKKWSAIRVGGSPKQHKITYWISKLNHKIYSYLAKNISFKYNFAENALGRCTKLHLRKGTNIKADLYIAHNLAALPIAVNLSKKNNAKCAFDAEDFHRNETSDDPNDSDVKLKTFIENKYIKQLDYLTAASPLIAKSYESLYPNLKPIVINNVFELKYQPKLNLNHHKGLKLFWFSQTIGKNRGLEEVINALNVIKNPLIELHLLGNLSIENSEYFNKIANFKINYYSPISGNEIFTFAAAFDIGLALEPGFCFNNKIALSNKLFSYLISGLAIIASDTSAQKAFLEENSGIGKLYPIGNNRDLVKIINDFFINKGLLNDYKEKSYKLAQIKYNWELEREKMIAIVSNTIEVNKE